MGLDVDNGRRVLLFERHCWAIKELNEKAKLAFFNAMLDYCTDCVTDFTDAGGLVRMMMPEIIALSRVSDANAERARNRRRTQSERNANETRTQSERNANETRTKRERSLSKEEEKESKDSSTVRVNAHMQPTIEEVYSQAESLNWLQYAPGWTMDQLRACLAETHAELTAHGWQDANGRPVKNWRAFFCKVVSEKKICAARAEVSSVPVYRFNPEAM